MSEGEAAVGAIRPREADAARESWTVTPVEPERDLDDILAVLDASFVNPWTREMLERELERSDVSRIFVLRDSRELLGFCACWALGDELHINNLAIKQDARRRGAASWLLRTVLGEAARLGLRRATLEVRPSNDLACRLYARLGFSIAGTRRGYYRSPDEDALILWHDDLASFARREGVSGGNPGSIDRAVDDDLGGGRRS